jgi:hypothetical protein
LRNLHRQLAARPKLAIVTSARLHRTQNIDSIGTLRDNEISELRANLLRRMGTLALIREALILALLVGRTETKEQITKAVTTHNLVVTTKSRSKLGMNLGRLRQRKQKQLRETAIATANHNRRRS